jgi:hypothetical protein
METSTYKEKLTAILGRPPVEGSVEYNKKILKLRTLEDSAKNLFEGLLNLPKYKAKAKKLGLL